MRPDPHSLQTIREPARPVAPWPPVWASPAFEIPYEAAYRMMVAIVNGQDFGQEVYPPGPLAPWLERARLRQRHYERTLSRAYLYLGYPSLRLADGRQLPLLYWPVRLARSEAAAGWSLSASAENRLYYLDDAALPACWQEQVAANQQNGIRGLNNLLAAAKDIWPPPVEEAAIAARAEAGDLRWEAVLGWGIAPIAWPAIAPGREAGHAPAVPVPSWLALDPEQAAAADQLQTREGCITITGRGKSYLAVEHVLRTLAAGRNCLVVARQLPALLRLRDAVLAQGLTQYDVLLRSTAQDRELLINLSLREKRRNGRRGGLPNRLVADWQNLYAQREAARQALQKTHRPIFGRHGWAATVGFYLAADARYTGPPLDIQLSAEGFGFQPEDYLQALEQIRQAQQYFRQVRRLPASLTALNAGIFLHQSETDSRAFIEQLIQRFTQESTRLHQRFLSLGQHYENYLQLRLNRQYTAYAGQLRSLAGSLARASRELGDRRLNGSRWLLWLTAWLNDASRRARQRLHQIDRQWQSLYDLRAQQPDLPADLFPAHRPRRAGEMQERLTLLQQRLELWRAGGPEMVKEEMLRLNVQTIATEGEMHGQVVQLEANLQRLVQALNESGLYQLPIEANMLTLPRQRKLLEQLIERLRELKLQMSDFSEFYHWQRHWLSLPARLRRILKPLLLYPQVDWAQAFAVWYFHQCLQAHDDTPLLPLSQDELARLFDEQQAAQALLPGVVEQCWPQRRPASTQATRRPELDLPALTQALPLWWATPLAAAELLSAGASFDTILLEEAHNLPAQMRQTLAAAATRQTVVLTADDPAPTLQLQSAYDRGPLAPLFHPAPPAAPPLLVQIDGRYDRESDSNEAEAQEVLRRLNAIEGRSDRTLPQVGVVAFTAGQRDLIQTYLWQIKAHKFPGWDRIQQLERNGLEVYSVDELSGQSFDIVLVSGTFGPIDLRGSLPPELEDWRAELAAEPIRQLAQAARQEVVLLNSLPFELTDRWLLDDGWNAAIAWAGCLRYAILLEEGDPAGQQAIIEEIHRRQHLVPVEPHPLLQEVAQRITAIRPGYTFLFNTWQADMLLPARLEQAPLALLIDGQLNIGPLACPLWEWRQQQRLASAGFTGVNIDSQHWWRAPAAACQQLIAELDKLIGEG